MGRANQHFNISSIFSEIEEIKKFNSIELLYTYLQKICGAYGLNSFGISGVPLPGEDMAPYFLMNGWEDEWHARYIERGYVHQDPVIRRVKTSIDPFTWRDATSNKKLGPIPQRIMNEAREFAMIEGFTIPIHSLLGYQAVITFGTDYYDLSEHDETALHMIAIYVHSQLRSIINSEVKKTDARNPEALTPRECECILWSAEGKTYEDIGTILSISGKMVETHMLRASNKMLTCDKAHLVAESIRAGIIR